MPNKVKFPTLSSFFVAFCIYIIIVLALFIKLTFFSEPPKKYTDDKDAIMDVVMVDREVEYLTRNCDRMLIHLIENHSSDILEEVYELKDKSKLNASGFVSAISLDNKRALLDKYLDKQANFAREKSIILLNRIKEEGDEAFTKDIITPSGQIDPLITDILEKQSNYK